MKHEFETRYTMKYLDTNEIVQPVSLYHNEHEAKQKRSMMITQRPIEIIEVKVVLEEKNDSNKQK